MGVKIEGSAALGPGARVSGYDASGLRLEAGVRVRIAAAAAAVWARSAAATNAQPTPHAAIYSQLRHRMIAARIPAPGMAAAALVACARRAAPVARSRRPAQAIGAWEHAGGVVKAIIYIFQCLSRMLLAQTPRAAADAGVSNLMRANVARLCWTLRAFKVENDEYI